MDKKVAKKIKMLDGITLAEWKKISYIIDTAFKQKGYELECSLKLTSDEAEKVIRAQFG